MSPTVSEYHLIFGATGQPIATHGRTIADDRAERYGTFPLYYLDAIHQSDEFPPSGWQTRFLHGEKHLISSLKAWFGQVTTGHGFMIIGSTLLAAATGSVSWPVAAPLLVAGVIGVVWPENTALQSASQATATDVMKMLDAFKNRGIPPTP